VIDEVSARLGEAITKEATAQAWRTALDVKGEWIPSVLAAADKRLTQVRRGVPDAGGLVIASNQTQARAYAKILHGISGERPVVVLSDYTGSSGKIEEFAQGNQRWMVAVRMVSEGVDVPRLCVGVYATSTSTPLYFAQAVGRFVRARRRGETASIFLPSVPAILEHAARLEDERDHALDRVGKPGDQASIWSAEDDQMEAVNRTGTADLEELSCEALESVAEFDHVLFDAQQFGLNAEVGSADEQEFLGLPGLLELDQVATLLRARQSAQRGAGRKKTDPVLATHRARTAARKELNALVSAYARKTGAAHAVVHTDLRKSCGGPALERADAAQVAQRIETIRRWFVGRR